MKRRSSGFTLLEVMLAVAIILMMAMLAVPSMEAIFGEDELRKSFDDFDAFAQKAQEEAMSKKQTVKLVWTEDGIVQIPDVAAGLEEDAGAEMPVFAHPEEGTIVLERPAALLAKAPVEWTFWRSGACEPARIVYDAPDGGWIAEYEPLTGRGRLIGMEAK